MNTLLALSVVQYFERVDYSGKWDILRTRILMVNGEEWYRSLIFPHCPGTLLVCWNNVCVCSYAYDEMGHTKHLIYVSRIAIH